MNRHEVISMVMKELDHAYELHPTWPKDQVHQSAIVLKEAGQLVEATLQRTYQPHKERNPIKEAVQTAAMAIRFLEANT